MTRRPRRAYAIVAAVAALAMLAAACSGGGTSASDKTATRAAADGPPPSAADIAGFVRAGFENLEIEYGVVNIPSFDNVDVLLGVLDDCDTGNAGDGITKDSADYWGVVLGNCYTVGNALGWLYQYTARKDFLYANLLMRRFNRAKFEEAVAGGASVGEEYWDLISSKIYALTPITTPIAVTPVP